ncbi:MAG: response regulator [Deltaproteobacteria bacterium]|nr:response regulator [Deltaproteobacteria bacterium]
MSDKKKVLALDDQKSMQNILNFSLKKEFDVTIVGTSDDAISKAKGESFDFILLDIVLDNDTRDGIGVAQELQGAGINTPVAFLSSLTQDSLADDQKERASGLNNIKFYQTKPIQPDDLVKKIYGVVGE